MVQIAVAEDEEIYVKNLSEYMYRYKREKDKSINLTIFYLISEAHIDPGGAAFEERSYIIVDGRKSCTR